MDPPAPGEPLLFLCIRHHVGLPRQLSDERICLQSKRQRFDPCVGKTPGGGLGNPPQCSCLENPMDGGAWRATVHGVTKGRTRLKGLRCTTPPPGPLAQSVPASVRAARSVKSRASEPGAGPPPPPPLPLPHCSPGLAHRALRGGREGGGYRSKRKVCTLMEILGK